MKNIFLLLIVLICQISAVAQTLSVSKEDSLMKARRTSAEEYFRNRRNYDALYARDKWAAVDSANTAMLNSKNSDERQKLIEKYQNNLRIDTLKEIDLSYCGLKELPEFVLNAKSLEVLLLDYNQIKKLPKELSELQNLKRIYWRGNQLEKFKWIRISKIDDLERLDLSNNQLKRLPTGIKNLDGLKELVLEENFFGEIPVKRLAKADFVKIVSFNKSHEFQIQGDKYESLKFLEVFKANNCGLLTLDASFYQMSGLKEIQLQENKLGELPTGISSMKNLEKLSFYKNEIKSLPDDLFDLNLKVIDLYYNQLEVIPDAIGQMRQLEVLFLAHNRIYSLPGSIGELTNLEEFYAHHNRLSVLPEELENLRKLRIARVNDNYLVDFPSQILKLPLLEDIDVSFNQIKMVPNEVSSLKHLKLFTYQENPIDFEAPSNADLGNVIIKMQDKGVICVPRVYTEEVAEVE